MHHRVNRFCKIYLDFLQKSQKTIKKTENLQDWTKSTCKNIANSPIIARIILTSDGKRGIIKGSDVKDDDVCACGANDVTLRVMMLPDGK